MTSTSLIAVVGVLLLSPFIQASLNPELIYDGIRIGVRNNQIIFRERCRGDRVQSLPPISRATLCNKLVSLHGNYNEAFLGVAVTVEGCIDALKSERKYTQPELNEWCGDYCGACTIINPFMTGFHNFECNIDFSTMPYRSVCTHITQAGTSSGYMEAGLSVSNSFLLPNKLYNIIFNSISESSQGIRSRILQ